MEEQELELENLIYESEIGELKSIICDENMVESEKDYRIDEFLQQFADKIIGKLEGEI